MKDFDILTLFAIAEEALGVWLWMAIAAAAMVVVLYLAIWRRGDRVRGMPRVVSAIIGILGAMGFAGLAPMLTDATHGDLAGAVDWIALGLGAIGVGVAIFLALLPVLALLAGRRTTSLQTAPKGVSYS